MTNTIHNVPRELLDRASNLAFQTQHYPLHEELRALLSAPSPAGVDGLEVVRKACEVANCKYPDMDAMADFKRDVTPSVVIGLLDGIRHAKGIAAINDARANGCAETVQFLRLELSAAQAIIDGLRVEVEALQSMITDLSKTGIRMRAERDNQARRAGELAAALEFACKSLAQVTSSDGSGHADIAVSVLRMAGRKEADASQIVEAYKAGAKWRIDAALSDGKDSAS